MADLYVEFSNPGQVGVYQLRVNMLYGWPRRGRRASDGAPVGPETPSPGNRYGWTIDQYTIIDHPTEHNRVAHPMVDPDHFVDHGVLSPAEIQWMRDQNARAAELTADWFPEGP